MPSFYIAGRERPLGAMLAAAASPFLLDTLSVSPIVAASTRKLRSLYLGSSIKVRSSAGGTQDIGFDGSGNLDTAALASFVGSNSGFVDTLYDQSGTGNDATQATTSAQPRVVNAGVNDTQNGHVSPLYINASGTFLNLPSQTVLQPITICCLLHLTVINAGRHMFDSNSGNRVLFGSDGGGTQYQMYNNGSSAFAGSLDTNTHFTCAIFNSGGGGGSQLYIDGSADLLGGNTTLGTAGWNGNEKFSEAGIDGFMSEILIFTSVLGSSDRSLIRASWQSYWGAP